MNDTVKSFFPFEKMGIDMKQVYLEDTPDYELDVKKEIEPCMEFIEEGMKNKTGTLVVCTAGMSRSATVCISYLMKYRDMGY